MRGPSPPSTGPRVAGPIADEGEAKLLEQVLLLTEIRRRLGVSLPRRR